MTSLREKNDKIQNIFEFGNKLILTKFDQSITLQIGNKLVFIETLQRSHSIIRDSIWQELLRKVQTRACRKKYLFFTLTKFDAKNC